MAEMEEYITGTGQRILVHNKDDCQGEYCVIHNPSDHHMKDWPTNWRDDRRIMERICLHGIGHPDPDSLRFIKEMAEKFGQKYYDKGIHGCDGCCIGKKFSKFKEEFSKEDFEI